jgi:hypothetical protein
MWDSIRDWLERYQERQRELAQGVEAGRVRANDRRLNLSLVSLGIGIVLFGILFRLKSAGFWRAVLETLAVVFLAGSTQLYYWYRREGWRIRRPEPKKPLSLFK